ncbi:BLUF domain-containing protein [Luteimonas sp. WGS1318]|uniref:BLUF domain-containing protein n=1 Tax=Luteimonas sp. WGS1318 TaxID=3366815 RepID=UPI00372D68EA
MIRQLLYRSGQLYEFTVADMIRLLQTSRAHNAGCGVGGLLLLRDGLFMQLLEGPMAAVEALYARIAEDPRHCGVQLINRRERAARLLPDWRMAWAEAPLDDDAPAFAGLETDHHALRALDGAGADPVAVTLRAFLRGETAQGGGLYAEPTR